MIQNVNLTTFNAVANKSLPYDKVYNFQKLYSYELEKEADDKKRELYE